MSVRSALARLIQIPPIPTTQDKRTRDWMTSVSSAFNRLLSGEDRVVTASELVSSGIATVGSGGALLPGAGGSGNLTVPTAITGLAALGAMDNIYLSWDAPAFTNFSYTEVWRASTNDLGAATKIGTTQAAVYVDAVGEGATRYYWVRAVSSSNVIGPYNGSSGVQGKTGKDPSYVMSLLTGQSWEANAIYDSFQYVRPTTQNGFQYLCVTGGTSAAVEPVWPTTPGATISDNTVTWRCQEATIRVPFVIGTIDGQPAVAMSGAFIEDATIRNAKIHSLAADKITAGQLVSGEWIQVGGSIWNGYNGYRAESYGGPAGFWLGVHGGVPRFQMTTAGDPPTGLTPPTYKRFTFDGYDFKLYNIDFLSSADGRFDDLEVDSLYARAVGGSVAAYKEYLFPSKHIELAAITDPSVFENYLGYIEPYRRTVSAEATGTVGKGWAYQAAYGNFTVTTGLLTTIIPYNEASSNRKRSYDKNIGFNIRTYIDGTGGGTSNTSEVSYFQVKILDQNDVERLVMTFDRVTIDGSTFVFSTPGGNITVTGAYREVASNRARMMLSCANDNGVLNYLNGDRFKSSISLFMGVTIGTSFDSQVIGTVTHQLQLITIPNPAEANQDALTISY